MKWVKDAKGEDFENLLEDQYMNHYKGTNALTSRYKICEKFENYFEGLISPEVYFPRSYHFFKKSKIDEFKRDYFTSMLITLVKKHIIYFKEVLVGGKFEAIKAEYEKEKAEMEKENRFLGSNWANLWSFKIPEEVIFF